MAYHDSTTNSGTSQTPSTNVPNNGGASPLQADDIVILAVSFDSSASNFETADWPSGFVQLDNAVNTLDGHRNVVGWKRLTGADTGSYTFDVVHTGNADWICQAFAFRGRHTTDPPVVSSQAVNDSSNTTPVSITANGVTALAGDDLLMLSLPDVANSGAGNGHTAPAGYTEREDQGGGFANLAGFTNENVSAGATGSVTATLALTSGGSAWTAWLVRIPVATSNVPATRIPFLGSFGRRRTRYAA